MHVYWSVQNIGGTVVRVGFGINSYLYLSMSIFLLISLFEIKLSQSDTFVLKK